MAIHFQDSTHLANLPNKPHPHTSEAWKERQKSDDRVSGLVSFQCR